MIFTFDSNEKLLTEEAVNSCIISIMHEDCAYRSNSIYLEVTMDRGVRNFGNGMAYFKYYRGIDHHNEKYEPLRIPFEYTDAKTKNKRLVYVSHNDHRQNNVEEYLKMPEKRILNELLKTQIHNYRLDRIDNDADKKDMTLWDYMVRMFNHKCSSYNIKYNVAQPDYRDLIVII